MDKLIPSISMPTIACTVLSFMFIINQASSARTIGNPTPTPTPHNHYHKIRFLMRDVLNVTQPSSKPATTKVTGQLPFFQKPLGLFPPSGGIPLIGSNPTVPAGTAVGLSTQTLDLSGIVGLSFPARATLQELESGTVTVIDQELFKGSSSSKNNNMSPMLGKAQGIYVASSEDGSSHMMAMTAYFDDFKDGLRFFGGHQTDVPESHIAVIGGIGKYQGANGYATVKAVNHVGSPTDDGEGKGTNYKLLLFNVYLS
ncbi:hypothetical protein FH972_001547 [Carpinus fangiana]|uniref:Dirigent protein n=1 Tax=Carpinus fangiana TaxID=176857 RepID=A0A5N6QC39_9ROSI|nr:hypothetical protein FH972_001547 [Carpinus fangiana]